ncbi:hypothetical protein [Alteriqipengyuania sp.]|uniref:hypothetical protein n=1 Tax=Alteriqipengyuania sp. TaxID=2800692 RepID=UPI003513D275
MHDLETLAHAELPGANRDLAAMQALAQRLVETGQTEARLRPLMRSLARDLEAALAGKAAPWSEARTRFEARKLARMAPAEADLRDSDEIAAEEGFHAFDPPLSYEEKKRLVVTRIAIAGVAAALWTVWIVSLGASGSVAWDGGTGPAQTQNLFVLYAPAVLALLATLIAITPPHEGARQ